MLSSFVGAGLVNEYIISIILGKGIPLFQPGHFEQKLVLKKVEKFDSGLVQIHYLPHDK